MKRTLRQKSTACFFLVVLLTGWSLPDAEGKDFAVFETAYSTIFENYLEAPENSYLANAALTGVADLVNAAGKEIPSALLEISVPDNKETSIKLVSKALKNIHDTTAIPREQLEHEAIRGMVKALDPHSSYLTPEESKDLQAGAKGSFGGVGLQVEIKNETLTIVSPIDDSPAFRAGIKAGDRIIMINNESTKGMAILAAVARMRGETGTNITLSIMRDGFSEPREFEITRDVIIVKSVKSKILDNDIGYIRIAQFQENTANDVESALRGMGSKKGGLKGLVLDLRSNPGGLLSAAVAVADKFINTEQIVSLKGRTESSVQKFVGKSMGTQPPYALIVLVNEGTASGSEILAGALQDQNKAVILGKRTFGKGTVQTLYPMTDGSMLRLTTAQYFLPSGRAIQGGIVPQIEVEEKERADSPLALAEATFLAAANTPGWRSVDKLTAIARDLAGEGPGSGSLSSGSAFNQKGAMAARSVRSDIDNLPPGQTKAHKNDYAIVIGIEHYRQKLPPADFATADARLVSEYLTKVMGYPEENVVTLLNDRASNVDLAKYFEKWLPNNAEKDATVFIYFSGHGAPNPKTGDAYLVPYDGDPAFIDETGYSLKRMYAALGKLPAKSIVVALDSCFSGAGGRSVIAKGARSITMNLKETALPSRNMTVLAASSGEQMSSTYDEKGHGLFTYFLLKGIKNEDVVAPDGSLRLDDLFAYLQPQVERVARKQFNNEQTPQLIHAN